MKIYLINTNNVKEKLRIEDYLKYVVASEMPNDWPLEALKAQAVAARTYACQALIAPRHSQDRANLCASTHCQVYRPKAEPNSNIIEAVHSTKGEIVTLNNQPINAVYSASCGGMTKNAKSVWGFPFHYLEEKKCFCNREKNGDGVGMFQNGARVLALKGCTYQQILNFYFPYTVLKTIKIKNIYSLYARLIDILKK